MTQRQKALVRQSFASIRELAEPFALLFYGRLFDLSPRLRPLFPSDLKTQGEKLMAMFETIAGSLDTADSLTGPLRELGAKHAAYGVKDDDYETLTGAFLWTLAQALEQGFNADTREAWGALLRSVCDEMRKGAAGATPPAP